MVENQNSQKCLNVWVCALHYLHSATLCVLGKSQGYRISIQQNANATKKHCSASSQMLKKA